MTAKRSLTTLITPEETEAICLSISSSRKCLAMTAIQWYEAPQNVDYWTLRDEGLICLTWQKDYHIFYFELFNLEKQCFTQSQELYENFTFKLFKKHFLSFEGDTNLIGFNFADELEAEGFCSAVELKDLQDSKSQSKTKSAFSASKKGGSQRRQSSRFKVKKKQINVENMFSGFFKKKAPRETLKDSIGAPQDFRHLNHVDLNQANKLDFARCDEQWRKLFSAIGIGKSMLKDPKTFNYIYDYVEDNGGISVALNEIKTYEEKNMKLPTLKDRSKKKVNRQTVIEQESARETDQPASPSPVPPPALAPPLPPNTKDFHPEIQEPRRTPESPPRDTDDFCQQIQRGLSLKKVTVDKQEDSVPSKPADAPLVNLLVESLKIMRSKTADDYSDPDNFSDSSDW